MKKITKNSISLAGEFAVLSRLALLGYDANMTLGHTKSVDILVSHPETGKMFKLEVKTKYAPFKTVNSQIFGQVYWWTMNEKHELIKDPNLYYCFVILSNKNYQQKFFIVPSSIVADYVKREHAYWLKVDLNHNENNMRQFRLAVEDGKYPIETPKAKDYEDNWEFKTK